MISVVTVAEQLNALKREYNELPYSKFRELVCNIISYKALPKCLVDEGIVYKLGRNVVFAKGLIRRSQIAPILESLRETNCKNVEKCLSKKKIINEAITLLEEYGYKVVKK